jgi:cyclase
MIKTRVIPILLWKNFGLVKGKNFNSWRRVGMLIPTVKIYNSRDVDELFFLDINATEEKRTPEEELIHEVAAECSVPLTVGGGISKIYEVEYLINSGADKISINSESYKNKNIIKEIAKKFGSQAIVSSIDVRKIEGKYFCFKNSGRVLLDINPLEWAKQLEDLGSGELLVTSIDKEGTMLGYDLEIIEKISKIVNIPVIASGGAGTYDHMYEVIKNGGASAVAASSIFHFTELTPHNAKLYLSSKGISVRK